MEKFVKNKIALASATFLLLLGMSSQADAAVGDIWRVDLGNEVLKNGDEANAESSGPFLTTTAFETMVSNDWENPDILSFFAGDVDEHVTGGAPMITVERNSSHLISAPFAVTTTETDPLLEDGIRFDTGAAMTPGTNILKIENLEDGNYEMVIYYFVDTDLGEVKVSPALTATSTSTLSGGAGFKMGYYDALVLNSGLSNNEIALESDGLDAVILGFQLAQVSVSAAIPEPGTYAMLASALGIPLCLKRRKFVS